MRENHNGSAMGISINTKPIRIRIQSTAKAMKGTECEKGNRPTVTRTGRRVPTAIVHETEVPPYINRVISQKKRGRFETIRERNTLTAFALRKIRGSENPGKLNIVPTTIGTVRKKNDLHSIKLNSSRDNSQRKLNPGCQDKREERERVVRVGDWSEHLSSSGKKYYYNCKTEVSQWEKPREWLDPRPQARHNYPQPNRSVNTLLDKHSNNSRSSLNTKSSNVLQSNRTDKPTSASNYWQPVHHDSSLMDPRKQDIPNSGVDGQATDMEICSGDSTPTSECSGGGGAGGGVELANAPGSLSHLTPMHVDTNSLPQDPGPPTPTHSETQDCTDVRKLVSPPSSLSSLQSLAAGSSLAAIRPQAPNLTPSLANHYRDDLVNHVRGWPADVVEKQAQKMGEEAHLLGSLCTKVSAELKSARSVVRLRETQATLQEQRVLFLRQQIKNLEELKSQNSFMADEA